MYVHIYNVYVLACLSVCVCVCACACACVTPSLQLCIDVQIPECFGGLGGEAVFVDTEGSLVAQRVADMAQAAVQHCCLQDQDAEQRDALKDFTTESLLGHLYLVGRGDTQEILEPRRKYTVQCKAL